MYNPFAKMTFTYDKCFLCGAELTGATSTEEHIYPKWLQKKFDLYDKELELLNFSVIKYRQLKIPCCKYCNERMSTLFEKPIERAVNGGYEKFNLLDKNLVFLWLNKLSYGMLFKELSLNLDLKNSNKGKIYTPESLKKHKVQYMFLQSILSNTQFVNPPYSMLIFKIDPCDFEKYWAFDDPFGKTFFIRMNDIGIISHLMDNGHNEKFFLQHKAMRDLTKQILHPIQFAEICARFSYKSKLLYKTPSYRMEMDDNQKPAQILSLSLSDNVYMDWSNETYAKCLAYFMQPFGLNYEDLYKGKLEQYSFLRNPDGSFKNMISNIN